jgi:hypothetical protein
MIIIKCTICGCDVEAYSKLKKYCNECITERLKQQKNNAQKKYLKTEKGKKYDKQLRKKKGYIYMAKYLKTEKGKDAIFRQNINKYPPELRELKRVQLELLRYCKNAN